MLDDRRLHAYEEDWLEDHFAWFNRHLPCPPFWQQNLPRDAVAWFKGDSRRFITRMWDIVAIIEEHGLPVRLLRSRNPGAIVYEDRCQVVVKEWRTL